MKKLLFLLAALALLWGFQQSVNVASAHGGSYRGPAGEVPPGQRDPTDPQPPPENPGPITPGGEGPPVTPPGNPGTGDDGGGTDSSKPKPPAPAGPVGPGPGGNVATPGGKIAKAKPMSFENWLFWWNYNKDEILNLKAKIKANEKKVSTTSSEHFFGDSGDRNRSESQAPTEAMIQEKIVPALVKVVSDKNIHADIRGGALIALARCGRSMTHVKTYFEVAKPGSTEDKVVQESAILALGILQLKTPEIRDFLINLLDSVDVPFRARCFAAISLGLLQDNSDEVFACLERCLDGSESTLDVPVAALLAIGLIGDNKKVPQLAGWLEEGRVGSNKLTDIEKAYLVAALGKIGDAGALKAVESALRKKGLYMHRSAVIALGQIVPQAEPAIQMDYMKKLVSVMKSEDDTTAKNFGIISIGRIAGASNAPENVREAGVAVLTEEFKNGGKTTERPYAAMALGLVCFEGDKSAAKPAELKYKIADLVRDELSKLKGDKTALAALAISLGMMGDTNKSTVELLTTILADRGLDKKLRGSAAVALGMIGDISAKDAILTALQEREDRDLRVDTAVAAGLLGDSSAVKELVKVLGDPKASQFVLGSVALALGQIGDHNAIQPLIDILEPEKTNGSYPDLTRALVAVSLGQLANREDIRVLFRISKDINYRASVSALDEVLTIL
jgi:HEAT repeat protein